MTTLATILRHCAARWELRPPTMWGRATIAVFAFNFAVTGDPVLFVLALAVPWLFCWFDRDDPA